MSAPVSVSLPNSLAHRDGKISAEFVDQRLRASLARCFDVPRRAGEASQHLDDQNAVLRVQILHGRGWSSDSLKNSGRRLVHIPKVSISIEVIFPFLSDGVVLPITIYLVDETSIFQQGDTAFESSIGDALPALLEVVLNPSQIVTSAGIGQKLQYPVIASSHPVRSTPAHANSTEEPPKTIFDLYAPWHIVVLNEPMMGQVLYLVDQDWFIRADATLLGGSARRKSPCTTPRGTSTGVASAPQRVLPTRVKQRIPVSKKAGTIRRRTVSRPDPRERCRTLVADEGPRRRRAHDYSADAPFGLSAMSSDDTTATAQTARDALDDAPYADRDWDELTWEQRIEAMLPVDIVHVPDMDAQCEMFSGYPESDAERCDLEAQYLVVYDVPQDEYGPQNVLMCPGDMRRWHDRNPGVEIREADA